MQRTSEGFTLVELLIVVVIIGILAAIAIPKFANTKQNAYLATVRTDLRNLVTAQEQYASNNGGNYMATCTASNSLNGSSQTACNGYLPSQGVTVTITSAVPGWSATAVHTLVSSGGYPGGRSYCAVYVNQAAVSPAIAEGVPAC